MSNNSEFEDSHSPIWAKVDELESKIEHNTLLTQQVVDNTSEIIAAFAAIKGTFKTVEFLGKIARPILWIVGVPAALTAAWAVIRTWLKW